MHPSEKPAILISETQTQTRKVEVRIVNSVFSVTVEASRLNNDPWTPPTVTFPSGRIPFELWKDLSDAIGKAFAEYETRFSRELPVLEIES